MTSLRRCHIHGVFIQRTFGAERHFAGRQRKQRVVLADADIHARVKFGTALTHDDAARIDDFAAKLLDTEHFGL